jgi:hypothetical protein
VGCLSTGSEIGADPDRIESQLRRAEAHQLINDLKR